METDDETNSSTYSQEFNEEVRSVIEINVVIVNSFFFTQEEVLELQYGLTRSSLDIYA